jgi:hypothetical protein
MEMIKKRLTNPIFYVNTLIGIATVIGGYFGVTGTDLTSWKVLIDTIVNAAQNPYVVFMVISYVYGVFVSTDTSGLSDPADSNE